MPDGTGVTHDVIVVGAGPCGSTIAGELGARGLDVLLLDKCTFPRPKPCGGGLTGKTASLVGPLLDEVVEDRLSVFESSLHFKNEFLHQSDKPLVYTVMRDRFDRLLLERATARGAKVKLGVRVGKVVEKQDLVELSVGGDLYKAALAVGADGAAGPVAAGLGFRRPGRVAAGAVLELEPLDPAEMDRWRGRVVMDFGVAPFGYGWVFPKGRSLNVGVYSLEADLKRLRDCFNRYAAARLDLKKFREPDLRGVKLRLIPLGGEERILHSRRAILAGDAAALADPLTGEGIYNAMRSAGLAAETIAGAAIDRQPERLAEYTGLVHREMLSDLKASWIIGSVFHRTIGLSYRAVTHPWAVSAYRRLFDRLSVRGEVPYSRMLKEGMQTFISRRPVGPQQGGPEGDAGDQG